VWECKEGISFDEEEGCASMLMLMNAAAKGLVPCLPQTLRYV
jgi:hypothetical protein